MGELAVTTLGTQGKVLLMLESAVQFWAQLQFVVAILPSISKLQL